MRRAGVTMIHEPNKYVRHFVDNLPGIPSASTRDAIFRDLLQTSLLE